MAGVPYWLFPSLNNVKKPGEKLGTFIKAVMPLERGGSTLYNQVEVASVQALSENLTAAGIRPGVCNMLTTHMPGEIAVCTTGHDMCGRSSLYEYLDASVPRCIPGALVLAGWPALPWGQHGLGPTPASLEVIALESPEISATMLDEMINTLFRLDSASPPCFHVGGKLRPAVRSMFATAIMYFQERKEAGELMVMRNKMRAVVQRSLCVGQGEAEAQILRWGASIKLKFKADNLRLTLQTAACDMTPVTAAVAELSSYFVKITTLLREQMARFEARLTSAVAARPGQQTISSSTPTPSSAQSSLNNEETPTAEDSPLPADGDDDVHLRTATYTSPTFSGTEHFLEPVAGVFPKPKDIITGKEAQVVFLECMKMHAGQVQALAPTTVTQHVSI